MAALVVALFFFSAHGGSVWLPPERVAEIIWRAVVGARVGDVHELIVLDLRLPRLCMATLGGAVLAIGGVVMQSLLRNPLAEPALTGVASGGAVAAAASLSFGLAFAGDWSLPIFAALGCCLALLITLSVARAYGRLDTTTLLLCGLAVNLLATSIIGWLMLVSDDSVLRGFTFWILGGFGLVTAQQVGVAFFILAPMVAIWFAGARVLNAFALGEDGAYYIGVSVERWKYALIFAVAVSVGVVVAFCGVIAFIGLIAPHLARLLVGAEHKALLPVAAACGAILTLSGDLIARTIALPGELPIGVITGLIGSPVFIYLLAANLRRAP